ncbi:NAD-dependent epimerase/dehydratase family protein [Micromonospora coxensis]|uniref:NAD-dependent epimerase/dehydratase family protein n=1 Tax=Micromonospora coxensis TaxID=356852 RepID=UPI0034369E02
MSQTRLLITGGAGFIGANLVRAALAAETYTVRVVDDFSTGLEANLAGLPVEVVRCSILDEPTLRRAVAGMDAVVHLAALPSVARSVADPLGSHRVNTTGTLNVLEAARHTGVRQVVVASSSSVYGGNPVLPKHELAWTRPLSPYAVTKLATEAYALAYQESFGMSTLAFRFFNVYGPGQRHDHAYAAVVPRFVHAALTGEPAVVHGDGLQSRDFTYVDTVCQVLLDAVWREVSHPQPVNLAYGTRTDLRSVIAEIETVLGREIEVRHAPPRPGDVRHSQAENVTLRKLFPDVVPTPLPVGLRATIDWFRTQNTSAASVAAR